MFQKRFHNKTNEKLTFANSSKMQSDGKFEASILNQIFHLKTYFILDTNIHHSGNLGTPFIMKLTISFLGPFVTCGTITPIEQSIQFANKFPDRITDKTQLQRFLRSLNYVLDFYSNINFLAKPLHHRLKINHEPLIDPYTQKVFGIPYLHLIDPNMPKIFEINASDIGYGGILKQT